ncbi:uncharacterized protein [Brachionichthys hirsutus]|uniref:uncharacterized protein n=1 Tax=Brachionichthys hirsutus TaxID=412623 RepID=UPI003604C81E
MEPKNQKGAVFIVHKVQDGTHQYGVENVLKYEKASGLNSFASGDKLMAINGLDLQNIMPEDLAKMLTMGSPTLTVHKDNRKEEHIEQSPPAEDTLVPVSKESTLLCFSMEMIREGDLKKNEYEVDEEERPILEQEVCKEDEEKEDMPDLLIVSMTKTSISLVSGRGCDDGPCEECRGTECSLNDVVLVTESSTLVVVSRGSGSLKLEKSSDYEIKQVASDLYLRGICSERSLYASPNPEKMTIYFYKSTGDNFRGLPVVLNLSKTNCFLRCCKQEQRVLLKVQSCEKERLKHISKSDESTLAFVFYMKSDRSKQRTFESAVNPGWFIHIINTDFVEVARLDGGTEEQSLLFIIQN